MRRWLLQLAVVLAVQMAVFSTSLTSAEPSLEVQSKARGLVEQLASRNHAPSNEGGKVQIPSDFDWKEQERVVAAAKALFAMGFEAFPELVSHENDLRYSCSVELPSDEANFAVGALCSWIVDSWIGVYNEDIRYLGRIKPNWLSSDQTLTNWWESNQKKQLYELQINAVEHALGEMRSWNLDDPDDFPYGDGVPIEKLRELRSSNEKKMESIIQKLKASKKPRVPKDLPLLFIEKPAIPNVTDGKAAKPVESQ